MEKDFDSQSDQELWHRVKQKDRFAFEKLYDRHWSALYVYAYNVFYDRNICEDIVQDIFTHVWLKKDTLHIFHIQGYLYKSVKFQVLKYLRRKKVTQNHLKSMDRLAFSRATEERLNFKELETNIEKYLEQLPERCREIFYMSRYDHFSIQEIADMLDIAPQTVKNQITKALNHLKLSMKKVIGISVLFLPLF